MLAVNLFQIFVHTISSELMLFFATKLTMMVDHHRQIVQREDTGLLYDAQPFVTKLGMMVHHHRAMSYKNIGLLSSRSRSQCGLNYTIKI